MHPSSIQPSAAVSAQTALAAHLLAISDDANINEAIALVPELEAIFAEARGIVAHPAPGITEAQVVSFVVQQTENLAASLGGRFCSIAIDVTRYCGGHCKVEWRSYVDGDKGRVSDDLSSAVAATVAAMSPDVRANELRAQAAKMLAEADALTATATPVNTATP